MAKQSGLAQTTLSVDDASGTAQDIRNDITSWSLKTPRAVQNTTGIDKSAEERLLLLADAQLEIDGVANFSANKSHAVLSSMSSTSVTRTSTLVIGGATFAFEGLITTFDYKRSAKGELTWKSTLMLSDGAVPTWS